MDARRGLTNGAITIRTFRGDDVDHILEAVRESRGEVGRWLPDLGASLTREQVALWLAQRPAAWAHGSAYAFAIVDARDGAFIGGCGLTNIHPRHRFANLFYWVRTSRAGQGAATAATLLLARFGFHDLALNRIEIVVGTENAPSLRVAEKVGAVREGLLRNRIALDDGVHDAVMFSLIPADVAGEAPADHRGGMSKQGRSTRRHGATEDEKL